MKKPNLGPDLIPPPSRIPSGVKQQRANARQNAQQRSSAENIVASLAEHSSAKAPTARQVKKSDATLNNNRKTDTPPNEYVTASSGIDRNRSVSIGINRPTYFCRMSS